MQSLLRTIRWCVEAPQLPLWAMHLPQENEREVVFLKPETDEATREVAAGAGAANEEHPEAD
eukprot:9105043-Alexandrium_andersonii.AAC.1